MWSVEQIMEWSPERQIEWLRSEPDEPSCGWKSLGTGATMAANSSVCTTSPERRDALGEIACYAYRVVSHGDERLGASIRLSELVLRAGLINRLGSLADTVRDELELMRLIQEELQAAETFKHLVVNEKVSPLAISKVELAGLRRVKNVLKSADLYLCQLAKMPSWLKFWWSKRQFLP